LPLRQEFRRIFDQKGKGGNWIVTKEQAAWQAKMFILASFLYYSTDVSIWTDEMFDAHCHDLIRWYSQLPEDFKHRVSIEDLRTGSGYFLSYTKEEENEAFNWYNRVNEKTPKFIKSD
jgi:hypothetical protein